MADAELQLIVSILSLGEKTEFDYIQDFRITSSELLK